LLYFVSGVNLAAVVFFLFATIFTLIIYNLDFFKKRILPDEDTEIKEFIRTIEAKKINDVKEFIKDHRQRLTESEIQNIIESKHGNNWIIYEYLFKYQKGSQQILMIMIEKNRLEICGDDLFLNYLKQFTFGLSYDNYLIMCNRFKDDKEVMKLLNLYNPSYNPNRSFFRSASKLTQSFYISVKQGKIASAITFICSALTIVSIMLNFKQIISATLLSEPINLNSILVIINLFFSMAIVALILIVFFTLILIGIAKFFWRILSLFSPTGPQIK